LAGALAVVDGAPQHLHGSIRFEVRRRIHIVAIARVAAVFFTAWYVGTRADYDIVPWSLWRRCVKYGGRAVERQSSEVRFVCTCTAGSAVSGVLTLLRLGVRAWSSVVVSCTDMVDEQRAVSSSHHLWTVGEVGLNDRLERVWACRRITGGVTNGAVWAPCVQATTVLHDCCIHVVCTLVEDDRPAPRTVQVIRVGDLLI
jgi:hypothetical protein